MSSGATRSEGPSLGRSMGRASTGEPVIAALATPEGVGEAAIVRVSGPGSRARVQELVAHVRTPSSPGRPARIEPVTLRLTDRARSHRTGVPALLVHYPEGRSYTGEESVEIVLPAIRAAVAALLARLGEAGVERAAPGEFTRRAFLAGRLDLTQAESVADLIAAEDRNEARAARRTLDGELGRAVHDIADDIHDWIALLEAGLDFADQEVEPPSPDEIVSGLAPLEERLARWTERADAGSAPGSALRVLLWGRANAGKSTLLNALVGEERAIVSETPGTTTDPVGGRLGRGPGAIEILDLPGRKDALSAVETDAEALSERERDTDDRILYLLDATRPAEDLVAEWESLPDAVRARARPVLSQVDRLPVAARSALPDLGPGTTACSGVTGEGIEDLRARLARFRDRGAYASRGLARLFNDRQRHRLEECRARLAAVREELVAAGRTEPELVVDDLRRAHESLEEITGEIAPDDTLERIFARFCVGK